MTALPQTLQAPAVLTHESGAAFRFRVARQAQARWAALPVAARAAKLSRLADLLLEQRDALADLIVDETGKPRLEALAHEVAPSAATVRWLCANAAGILAERRFSPSAMPVRDVTVCRVPHGVALVISPWNLPLAIPLGTVAAALVAGNAVVLKPSEVTPRTADALGALLARCDLPPGLFQVAHGDGGVGAELVAARPDKVFFTGSLATGRKVMAAAAVHPVPVSLELGGIDALIVCDDADVELASSAIAFGAVFNHGQVCASVERVLVHERLHDVLVARVADKLGRIEASDLGRVTFPAQRRVIDRHVSDARSRGLRLACGGAWAGDRFEPTVICGEGVRDALVWREETFGPVVAFSPFRDHDEAVRLHDDTEFGLTASVFSRSLPRAERIARRLRAGAVSVNDVAASLHAYGEVPWGGVGGSGFGRSHGREGLLDCTIAKVIDKPRRGVPAFKPPWWFPYDPDIQAAMADFGDAVAHRRLGRRLGGWARMGRGVLRQLSRNPRL